MDIGTNKEKMVTQDGPDFPIAIGWGAGHGEKVLCFYEDWLSLSISLCGRTRGQGEYRSSAAVFSSNQKPSFPSQANLEKKCPT